MQDILSEIVANKRLEIAAQKAAVSLAQLREQVDKLIEEQAASAQSLPRRSMKQSLASSPSGIISEFKRRSPSKGWIHQDAQADVIPPAYEAAGASALSILTDEKYFGGTLRDIRTARPLTNLPILRKDFIIDEYQLLQARLIGADAVLLIAACLTPEECTTLTTQAHTLGLEVLLEIHSDSELAYVNTEVDMVGVNNRNLGTFVTDVNNSFRIAEALRSKVAETASATGRPLSEVHIPVLVSESGISKPEVVRQLRDAGFRGFLMGEAFMKTASPGDALKDLLQHLFNG
ncbi:MAG: indole-3-glycerol phosphate synthase TrpC [Bacteroides sp.]|nr:indole-3-glycerol phosphate synthase TrpC [Bacteroides sp.]